MDLKLRTRRAIIDDLGAIVNLLIEDELRSFLGREKTSDKFDQRYIDAFAFIDTMG